jgi:hypothetical protein
VILLDSDVLLIDQRYQNDPRYLVNRQAIELAQANSVSLGLTAQAFLEVIGILSFNLSPAALAALPSALISLYGLTVRPDLKTHPDYAGCTAPELLTQMATQMALGDAVQAVQIAHYASDPQCLLTWNARHFQGKIAISVLTPEEWLKQQRATP